MARCCGLAVLKGARRERCYSVLSRGQRHARGSTGHSQSTDNSGHSVRDDSYASHAVSEATSQLSRYTHHIHIISPYKSFELNNTPDLTIQKHYTLYLLQLHTYTIPKIDNFVLMSKRQKKFPVYP